LRLVLAGGSDVADLQLLADAASRLPKLRQALFDLGELLPEIRVVQGDVGPAKRAGEVRLGLQLPDRLRELAAATRAGEFDGL